jgi:hypothetical protein
MPVGAKVSSARRGDREEKMRTANVPIRLGIFKFMELSIFSGR